MNTNRNPLTLPESPVTPLPAHKLEAMINRALTHPQKPRAAQSNVVPFMRPWAFTTGMTALAASLLLAITLIPMATQTTQATSGLDSTTLQDDLPTLLLYSTLSS